MENLLKKCDQLYLRQPCCHTDGRICLCSNCFTEDYYQMPDSYNCVKKLCYYTMNYGPMLASEIYHYFDKSKLLENLGKQNPIRVLSLGCGFAPDAYALEKYIKDKNLNITFNYFGLDLANEWEIIREEKENRHYETRNILNGFTLKDYDIIFLCKVFSTIKRNNTDGGISFLDILREEIKNMESGSYFIFNDINHRDFGRDMFHYAVRGMFSSNRRFYFPISNAYTGDFEKINNVWNVFTHPYDLHVSPKEYVNKTIIFEYRK